MGRRSSQATSSARAVALAVVDAVRLGDAVP